MKIRAGTFSLLLVCVSLVFSTAIFGQTDRGTITGVVSDPAGAIVANAAVEAKSVETGAVYRAATTATGNYTLSELPTGTYDVSISVAGFKKYVRSGLALLVAQTLRIDATLEVGNTSDTVTVTEAAPLLKTESGELSHNVTAQRMDELPILGIGQAQASGAGIRNPLAVAQLLPGVVYVGSSFPANTNSTVRINGTPTNSEAIRIEGQDATNDLGNGAYAQSQPSVDAIQEFAIQTSNFSAEFGLAGGAVFNMTMKSGTNQFHGSLYDYFVNEALNAGTPFTSNGAGQLTRNVARRNDYGATFGGPVRIPKVYNGRDKTFFFINWEQFRENQFINNTFITVPTQDFRNGNFSAAQLAVNNKVLGTDPLGRPIIQNTVYDPGSQRVVNNQQVRDAYVGNTIPTAKLDPVALKIQALIPLPTLPGLVNNGLYPFGTDNLTTIPSVKIDHLLSDTQKLSFYWMWTHRASIFSNGNGGYEGLPQPISAAGETKFDAHTERLNYDRTLSPTLLLHMGVGYSDTFLNQPSFTQNFNPTTALGLQGPFIPYSFPQMSGLSAAQGGMANMGAAFGGAMDTIEQKTTATVNLTWVKNDHTYKAGSEMRNEGFPNVANLGTTGSYAFSAAETGLPYLNQTTVAGSPIGFPYASMLLGLVDSGNIKVPAEGHLGKQEWSFYGQDSWKVTRKFTLDYGLRYDYSTAETETYGRLPSFSATTANPSAGGHPGAVSYEATCGCTFAHNYPWAFGPRIGAAYQISSKMVLRGGAGVIYNGTDNNNLATRMVSSSNPFSSPSFGQPAMTFAGGVPFTAAQIAWPNFNPGYYPFAGSLTGPPLVIDPNAGRPARTYQWSMGLQREIARDFVVEATYVGNRGIWWQAPTQVNYNALTPQTLALYGLNPNSAADVAILNAPLSSATAGRFQNKVPYAGFPVTSTVAQSLRPFPQFSSGLTPLWAPLGDSWYESLQVKATKRFSHGLDFTYTFTWQKTLDIGAESDSPAGSTGQVNDVFNRPVNKNLSVYDQPFVSTIAGSYTFPKWGGNKIVSYIVRDWQFSTLLNYASGLPILAPVSTNNLSATLFQSTFDNRVPGVPLFTQDLNCHCFDPNTTFVLNPAAWTNPPAGQFGTGAAYYSDYRQQRRPSESMGFGRNFKIRENMTFNIRAEFNNVFNRTEVASPTSTNIAAAQTKNAAGQTTAGFGWINTTSLASMPRQGSIVARFRF